MALPSFDDKWWEGQQQKPRIQVLEIRDRDKPDSPPIAWLLVEREEVYRRDPRDDSIYEASIRLYYECILPKSAHHSRTKGRFDGSYSKGFNAQSSVSLTSASSGRGAVFLDLPGLQGQRIGTYLMNEIVTWAKRWPDAMVNRVQLLAGQANDENKDRRNWFYEQFGLVFDYTDSEHREGRSRQIPAAALRSIDTWKANIRERRIQDYLADVLFAKERASLELADRERAVKSLLNDRKEAEAKPVRWALRMLWWRYAGAMIGGAFMAGLAALAWLKLNS